MSEVNARAHLDSMVNAVLALSPSRNMILQFLSMLPQDYSIMHDSYPEIMRDGNTLEAFRKLFGISYGDRVDRGHFGNTLVTFVSKSLETFDEKDFRESLSVLLRGMRVEPLLNPRKEWLELRLRRILLMPNGEKALKLLNSMAKRGSGSITVSYHGSSRYASNRMLEAQNEMVKVTGEDGIDLHSELPEVVKLLSMYRLFELKTDRYDYASGSDYRSYHVSSDDVKTI